MKGSQTDVQSAAPLLTNYVLNTGCLMRLSRALRSVDQRHVSSLQLVLFHFHSCWTMQGFIHSHHLLCFLTLDLWMDCVKMHCSNYQDGFRKLESVATVFSCTVFNFLLVWFHVRAAGGSMLWSDGSSVWSSCWWVRVTEKKTTQWQYSPSSSSLPAK